jgi:beta-lactamase class A
VEGTGSSFLSRRAMLGLGGGVGLVAVLSSGAKADASSASAGGGRMSERLSEIEGRHGARLGVFARNLVTGGTVAYRSGERFPVCSVVKTVVAAAVLRDLDRHGEFLAARIRYSGKDVADSGYAPITGRPANLAGGMTVADLCAAALAYSDNAAANLLLRELGGPAAVTRFCRSIGDGTTRLDRWEPALNSAEPWRVTDTTSPRAIGQTFVRLTLGNAPAPDERQLLTGWLLANTTGAARLRAGLPKGWILADKTGTGAFGTTNDVGIAWTPDSTPIVLAVLSTKQDADAPADEPLLAEVAALLAAALA